MDFLADLDKLAAKKATGFRPTARGRPAPHRPQKNTSANADADAAAASGRQGLTQHQPQQAAAPPAQHPAPAGKPQAGSLTQLAAASRAGLDVSGLAAAPRKARFTPAARTKASAATAAENGLSLSGDCAVGDGSHQKEQHAALRGVHEPVATQLPATPVVDAAPAPDAAPATQPSAPQAQQQQQPQQHQQPGAQPALSQHKGQSSVLAAVAEHFGASAVLARRRPRKPPKGALVDAAEAVEPVKRKRGRPLGSGKKQKLAETANGQLPTPAATAPNQVAPVADSSQQATAGTTRRPRRAAAVGAAAAAAAAVQEDHDSDAAAGSDSSSDWDANRNQQAAAAAEASASSASEADLASEGEESLGTRSKSTAACGRGRGRGRGRGPGRAGKATSNGSADAGPSTRSGRPSRKAAAAAAAANAEAAQADAAAADDDKDQELDEDEDADPASIARKQQLSLCNRRGRICPDIDIKQPIDLEHWSLSMLNKRASAWEQQECRAARKRLKQQQAEAAEAGEDGATAAGAGPAVTAAGSGSQRSGAAAGGGSRSGGGGASFAPQVRIGEDGAVVLDVQSLTVQAQEQDIENFTRVDEQHRQLNSMTYMNRRTCERWTEAETNLFYRALTMFGTDFTAIAALFPNRDRVHMRKKFKKESKVDPERVNKAMSGVALDEQELAELSAVVQAAVEANEEEPEQPQEHEEQPAAAAAAAAATGDGADGVDAEADHLENLRPPGSISVGL